MSPKRIEAFTILELTVAMLISAIVIGITYTTYTIVVKSYGSFSLKNRDMAVIMQLDRLLKRDISKADLVFKSPDGIGIKTQSQLISYRFQPDYVVRIAAIVDTFKVKTDELNTWFEGQPAVLSETEVQNPVDEFSFSLNYQNEKIPYHYRKQYSSVNLMPQNPDAIH